jgi:hypothetical protein
MLLYPVRADTGITIQSLRPIKCALWLKTGFTSRTPMQSGISCLFANTRRGTPFKQLLEIILSVNSIIQATYNTMLLQEWQWTNVARGYISFCSTSFIWKAKEEDKNLNSKHSPQKIIICTVYWIWKGTSTSKIAKNVYDTKLLNTFR